MNGDKNKHELQTKTGNYINHYILIQINKAWILLTEMVQHLV